MFMEEKEMFKGYPMFNSYLNGALVCLKNIMYQIQGQIEKRWDSNDI